MAGAASDACGDGTEVCKRWGVAVLVAIGTHESHWAADVDAGKCYRGPGHELRCDSGHSWTAWQMHGTPEEGAAWAADRKGAAREALRQAMRSWNGCRKTVADPAQRWAAYARGNCSSKEGQAISVDLDALVRSALAVRVPVDGGSSVR